MNECRVAAFLNFQLEKNKNGPTAYHHPIKIPNYLKEYS